MAWTECPESLRVLGPAAGRLASGVGQVVVAAPRVFLNRPDVVLGKVCIPYLVFVELLVPVIEPLGCIGLSISVGGGLLNTSSAGLVFLEAFGIGAVLSTDAVLLGEWSFSRYARFGDRFRLSAVFRFEPFGYLQLSVPWRLRGFWRFIRGRTERRRMGRRGFAAPSPRRLPVPLGLLPNA